MIDKNFPFDEFRQDVQNALKEVEKKYEMFIEPGNISYNNVSINLKLMCTEKIDGAESSGQVNWNANCHYYGFKPEDFGKTLYIDGVKYQIAGINMNATRMPIILKKVGEDSMVKVTVNLALNSLENNS